MLQDELHQRPMVTRVLNRLANYDGGMVPNVEQTEQAAEAVEEDTESGKKKKKKKPPKVSGAFFPGQVHDYM